MASKLHKSNKDIKHKEFSMIIITNYVFIKTYTKNLNQLKPFKYLKTEITLRNISGIVVLEDFFNGELFKKKSIEK